MLDFFGSHSNFQRYVVLYELLNICSSVARIYVYVKSKGYVSNLLHDLRSKYMYNVPFVDR